jgi:hypothetical protein
VDDLYGSPAGGALGDTSQSFHQHLLPAKASVTLNAAWQPGSLAAWEAMRIAIGGSPGFMAERLAFESSKALKENWPHRAQGWASVEFDSSSSLMGRRVSRMMATVRRPDSSPIHWSRYPAYESGRLDGARRLVRRSPGHQMGARPVTGNGITVDRDPKFSKANKLSPLYTDGEATSTSCIPRV